MKRFLVLWILIFQGVLILQAAPSVIRVYNWTNYMDPALLDQFTQETGIRVIYKTYESNNTLVKDIMNGKTKYDIVFPTAAFVSELVDLNALQKIDQSKLPNLKFTDNTLDQHVNKFPQLSDYSVNWMWGMTGLAFNKEKILARLPDATFDSLDLLFNPDLVKELASCGVYVIDDAEDVISAALLYLNKDPMSANLNDLKQAQQLIENILPYIKFAGSEQVTALAMGSACLSLGYSGDVLMAQDKADKLRNGINISFLVPKTGGIIWMDQISIPANATNPEGAHAFINFLMEPKNNAQAQNYLNYASNNHAARVLVKGENLTNNAIYPNVEILQNAYLNTALTQQQRQIHNEIWQNIQKNHSKNAQ